MLGSCKPLGQGLCEICTFSWFLMLVTQRLMQTLRPGTLWNTPCGCDGLQLKMIDMMQSWNSYKYSFPRSIDNLTRRNIFGWRGMKYDPTVLWPDDSEREWRTDNKKEILSQIKCQLHYFLSSLYTTLCLVNTVSTSPWFPPATCAASYVTTPNGCSSQ